MKLVPGKIYIMLTRHGKKTVPFKLEEKQAEIDEKRQIGYFEKYLDLWVATDIPTGCAVAQGNTLQDAVYATRDRWDAIKKFRFTDMYAKCKDRHDRLLELPGMER